MIVVLSGEGPTDLGQCTTPSSPCTGADFRPGPLTVLLNWLLEPLLGYAPADVDETFHFVPKAELLRRAEAMKQGRRMGLPGAKRGQETNFFYKNAWMLGEAALALEDERQDRGIAVLHRDADTRNRTPATEWAQKVQSMEDGFTRAGYDRGVPMLPRPISEAWLLCLARQTGPACALLEDEAGNPDSANPLKRQLADALGLEEEASATALVAWLAQTSPDWTRLGGMPSFAHFHQRLQNATQAALRA